MKKILLAALEYPPKIGGVEEYYRSLVEASDGAIHPYIGPEKLFWRIWPRWLPMLWRIPREMKRVGADIVFAGEVLPVGEALWLLHLFSSYLHLFVSSSPVRYGVFVHGLDLALTGHKRWIARQVLKNATWVIANSECTKKIALGYGLDSKKVHVLPPCPSVTLTLALSQKEREGARPPRPLGEGGGEGWRLLTVARFVQRKGYDTAVAVAQELKKRGQAFEWTFIGDGSDKKRIQDLARSLDVIDSIRWLDSQPAALLGQEYQRADLFVFLPRELPNGDVEGFGMVCLEAALYGLPVVASKSGGVSEAVVDGITGILTSPTDIQKIADDILRLMNDPEAIKKMGETGKERVLKEFRWEDRVEQLLIIFNGG